MPVDVGHGDEALAPSPTAASFASPSSTRAAASGGGALPLDKIKITLVEGESGPQHQHISGFSHPHHPIYTVRAMLRVIGVGVRCLHPMPM